MAETVGRELFTSPTTGRVRELEYRTDPAGEFTVNPQALQQLFQTRKIAEAEKAMAAAIQFQGLRGYQNALQSGKPAAEALTRYGPMMFYSRPQAFGPSVRAVTPPAITPFQERSLKIREDAAKAPVIRSGASPLLRVDQTTGEVTTIHPGSNRNISESDRAIIRRLGNNLADIRSAIPLLTPDERAIQENAAQSIETEIEKIMRKYQQAPERRTLTPPKQFQVPVESIPLGAPKDPSIFMGDPNRPVIQDEPMAPLRAPSGSSNRIRVEGPNGQRGTMDANDTLPKGWKRIP